MKRDIEKKSNVLFEKCAAGCDAAVRRTVNRIIDLNNEALDCEVWEWLKEHGSEETMRVIMMTARHFAAWGFTQALDTLEAGSDFVSD